ncbi:MAG: hypothetical protein HWE11_06905 [Gammaproteobacteria bacterium]|nr:hypothetical protein [Gammaproteobacteria bacterium]
MFDKKSRYQGLQNHTVQDARGRAVLITDFATKPEQSLRGIHILREGERLDHLATHYLADSSGYWKIAEQNDAMTADVLAEQREIEIPNR